jgi:hypothetical protein
VALLESLDGRLWDAHKLPAKPERLQLAPFDEIADVTFGTRPTMSQLSRGEGQAFS